MPIICFNINEVSHIATRCIQKKNHKEGNKYKNKREGNSRDYKDKGKRCYIVEEENSDENDNEVVYVAMKDESDEDKKKKLVTCVKKNDRWIIDSGCSHHMT